MPQPTSSTVLPAANARLAGQSFGELLLGLCRRFSGDPTGRDECAAPREANRTASPDRNAGGLISSQRLDIRSWRAGSLGPYLPAGPAGATGGGRFIFLDDVRPRRKVPTGRPRRWRRASPCRACMPKSDCRSDTWPRSRTQPFCSTASATTLIFFVTPCNASSPSSKYCGNPLVLRSARAGRIDRARRRGEPQHVEHVRAEHVGGDFLLRVRIGRARAARAPFGRNPDRR